MCLILGDVALCLEGHMEGCLSFPVSLKVCGKVLVNTWEQFLSDGLNQVSTHKMPRRNANFAVKL